MKVDPNPTQGSGSPSVLQVREISNSMLREPFRWTAEALLALQEVRPCCCNDQELGSR